MTTSVEFYGSEQYFTFDEGELKISYTGEQVLDFTDFFVTIDLRCDEFSLENSYYFELNIFPIDSGTGENADSGTAENADSGTAENADSGTAENADNGADDGIIDEAADDNSDNTAVDSLASNTTETESVEAVTEAEETVIDLTEITT